MEANVYLRLTVATLIANITDANTSSYVHTVPPDTNEEAYYAITYFVPNKTEPDDRLYRSPFLSGNALTQPVLEDNRPPNHVSIYSINSRVLRRRNR